MMFLINAQDTAGNVTLNRTSVPAALKKAGELISDGCWNVEIVTPDGATYHAGEFDQLKERTGSEGFEQPMSAQQQPAAARTRWPSCFPAPDITLPG